MRTRGERGSLVGTSSQGATRGFFSGFLTGNGPDLGNDDPWTQARRAPPARCSRSGMRTSRDEQTSRHWRASIKSRSQLRCYRDRTDRSDNPGLARLLFSVGRLRSGVGDAEVGSRQRARSAPCRRPSGPDSPVLGTRRLFLDQVPRRCRRDIFAGGLVGCR